MNQPRETILIIDTDAASRNYVAGVLEKEGFLVLTAESGREGLIAAWKDQPNIIIFDPGLPDLPGEQLVSRLRQDRRTSNVPCVALASRENAQEMSALLAAGCNEYFLKTGEAVDRLLQVIPRLLNRKSQAAKKGKMIAFIGAKGGMGTSSLCANLAMCAAGLRLESQVAVLDLALPMGSIAHIVGHRGPSNITVAEFAPGGPGSGGPFKEPLPKIKNWEFHLAAGSPDPASANQVTAERARQVWLAMREEFDTIFIDMGSTISPVLVPLLQLANQVVLVIGTDLVSAALTQALVEYIKINGIEVERITVVQNRSVGLTGLTKAETEKMIGLPIFTTIPYLGENLTSANNRHEPYVTRFTGDATTLTFRDLAEKILVSAEADKR